MMTRLRRRLGAWMGQPAPAGAHVQTLSESTSESPAGRACPPDAHGTGADGGWIALTDLPVGAAASVIRLAGGHGMQGRLASMGLHVGSRVRLLHAPRGSGPALVGIGQTRLAIGRGMAERILVSPVPVE